MKDFEHLTEAERAVLRASLKADIDETTDEGDARVQAAALGDRDSPPGLITKARRVGRPPATSRR